MHTPSLGSSSERSEAEENKRRTACFVASCPSTTSPSLPLSAPKEARITRMDSLDSDSFFIITLFQQGEQPGRVTRCARVKGGAADGGRGGAAGRASTFSPDQSSERRACCLQVQPPFTGRGGSLGARELEAGTPTYESPRSLVQQGEVSSLLKWSKTPAFGDWVLTTRCSTTFR